MNWITGEVAPAELAEVNVPVILDGAQGSGAVPVDVQALGCAAYAAAGQKWLCGADGTGMLFVDPEFGERVRTIAPTYGSFEDASRGLDSVLRAGGRRFDAALSREAIAFSCAALEVLVAADLDARWSVPPTWRTRSRARSRSAGHTVAPRGRSTLVAFEYPEPAEARQRLAEAGIAVRDLPGHPYLRASVGAWNDESDLERLLGALCEVRLRLLRVEHRLGPGLRRGGGRARAGARGRGLRVVYGGAHVGLMGLIADTALAAGAEVVGVIPRCWSSGRSRTPG